MNRMILRRPEKRSPNRVLGRLFTIPVLFAMLAVSGTGVFAGGLVDTSSERFANSIFENSSTITNPWWTLTAGSNRLYFAVTDDGCAWNLVEVLELTQSSFEGIYAGTLARVVLDRVWLDETCEFDNFADVYSHFDPEEATYDWYAEDSDWNIWYMGEDTVDAEGSREGSFVAGCDGAEAGIVMLGNPEKGASYQQEFYEDEAEDWGKVLNFVEVDGQQCLKTKEWTPLEPGHIEHKLYCSDGTSGELVMVKELKGKTVVVELIDYDVVAPPAPGESPSPTPVCVE